MYYAKPSLGLLMAVVFLGCMNSNSQENSATSTKNTTIPEIVFVKGGSFEMGQADGEFDEKPVHKVTLSDFYVGKFEISVGQYREFCTETGREMPKEPGWGWVEDHPIVNTSWNDSQAYINWLNKKTGESFRLPTEAEFDYVIREGGKPGDYPWGDGMPKNENIADESYSIEYPSRRFWKGYDDGYVHASPIGSFPANALGVHDINGNVWEWVSDWHTEFSGDPVKDPKGPETGKHKVGKGASFDADPWHSRTASRAFVEPTFTAPGFRIAKDAASGSVKKKVGSGNDSPVFLFNQLI